ncbi:hypothetical protein CAPTEDRAFT_222987 [Capitella teleta]|uniref:Fork-head domain-containing protein n=1 Tax=Capitella teleta TaxID=283909 RepID=R7TG11_CAPTE|nr:hypothetical protein CAPTEDRAFT_222987 [Capitella teleta]|eukprot:ELT89986.1 hypothetical protein CAPTEDRAFT_222987 [Capitella teleta]
MPPLTRETLAQRLRQNWMAKHPVDAPPPTNGAALDDSLTSLNWLHNLNIMKIASPTPPASPQPGDAVPGGLMTASSESYATSGNMQVNPNSILNVTNLPRNNLGRELPGCRGLVDLRAPCNPLEKIDYKHNPHVKPPYSYATLICMAMKESKKNKVTLSGIYNWITENFMYYRMADPSWQNSIRHNLSLNKCFQKVPRRKDEPGKGGFWRINPEYQDMFVNGVFKKRRGSTSCMPTMATAPPMKRMKREEEDYQATLSISGASCGGVLPSASVLLTPATPGSMTGPLSPFTDIKVKKEPGLGDHMEQIGARAECALNGDGLDFTWSAILNQDVEVDCARVKTEEVIDDKEATAIMDLSPPPSDDSSSEVALDEFLTFPNSDSKTSNDKNALDLTNGQPLDLSIQGTSLKPPGWWADSLTGQMFPSSVSGPSDGPGGLHTPIHAPSPEYSHPWAESRAEDLDQAIASFDTDIFLDIPSPGGRVTRKCKVLEFDLDRHATGQYVTLNPDKLIRHSEIFLKVKGNDRHEIP